MSPTHLHRFIDPRTLAAIKDLPLIARSVVDGFMFGHHPGRTTGPGFEFAQYRSYQPGDDLRRIDWKLYARSDRFYVRETDVETSISLWLLLDASASMRYKEDGILRFDYARFLAAALAYLGVGQGDAVGLTILRDEQVDAFPPRRGPQHLHRLLHALDGLRASGRWPGWDTLESALGAGGGRGIVVVVTDLHEEGDEIRAALSRIRALGHELLVFHLAGRREDELDFQGVTAFEDLETGRVVQVDAARDRAVYRERVDRHVTAVRQDLSDLGAEYARLLITEPLDAALRTFLIRRRA